MATLLRVKLTALRAFIFRFSKETVYILSVITSFIYLSFIDVLSTNHHFALPPSLFQAGVATVLVFRACFSAYLLMSSALLLKLTLI